MHCGLFANFVSIDAHQIFTETFGKFLICRFRDLDKLMNALRKEERIRTQPLFLLCACVFTPPPLEVMAL